MTAYWYYDFHMSSDRPIIQDFISKSDRIYYVNFVPDEFTSTDTVWKPIRWILNYVPGSKLSGHSKNPAAV